MISSRRFACDRCRGQKLRCLREKLDPTRCDRCLKAEAECLTTPPSMIRPPDTEATQSGSRKRRFRDQSDLGRATFEPYHPPTNDVDANDLGGLPLHGIGEFYASMKSWEESMNDIDLEADLGSFMLDSWTYGKPADTTTSNPEPTLPPHILPGDTSSNETTASTLNRETSTTTGDGSLSLVLDGVLGSHSTPHPSQDNPSEGCCLRLLSQINLALISQLGRVSHGSPSITLDMLITAPDEGDPMATSLVETLLCNTREFIGVLEAVIGGRKPVGGSTSGSATESDSSPNSGIIQLEKPPSVDVTTVLLILSCYMHTLRLYVILFAHILQFLQEIAESQDPTLCPLPNMGFGNFMVDSGNLQATMFIQMVTGLFEKLERLLGLPPEFRVTVRAVDRGGLCAQGHFQQIVTTVLSNDEAGKAENGKGGVASLRKSMKKSMQLLRENIAP